MLAHRVGETGIATQLKDLADLVDRGYLTRAEFDLLKQALLGAAATRIG
jgi:hypothetical protein